MIASLNRVVKTFAKIAKSFVGLSTMIISLNTVVQTFAIIAIAFIGLVVKIIAMRRRNIHVLHLEAK